MKILAFTDYHGVEESLLLLQAKALDVDLLLCCGDIALQNGIYLEDACSHLDALGKRTLIIQGNHEDGELLEKLCKKSVHLISLHQSTWSDYDASLIVAGYGWNGPQTRDPAFVEWMQSLPDINGYATRILMTHQPPYGTSLDMFCGVGRHIGNKDFAAAAEKFTYYFSGHNHETFGREDQLGVCRVINPGPEGVIIEVSHQQR